MRHSKVSGRKWLGLRMGALALLAFLPASAEDPAGHVKEADPVKAEKVYPLPFFCIAEGLQGSGLKPREADKNACPDKSILVPPGNADDVATKLQPQATPSTGGSPVATAAATAGTATATATGTGLAPPNQFVLTATDDKRSIIVFCRAKECAASEFGKLSKAIDDLARPVYAYFKDYPIDSVRTGKALLKAVPVINPKLRAEVLRADRLRVESDKPLSEAEQAVFEERLARDTAAAAAATPPTPDDIKKQVKSDLGGSAPDLQITAVALPFFCQSGNLSDVPTAPDKDNKCASGTLVQANNIDAIVTALTGALGKTSKLSLSKDGASILIACETKCTGEAVSIAQDTINSTARIAPLFVQVLEVPRGTAGLAAKLLNSAPITAKALTDTLVRLSSETPVPAGDLDARREFVREHGFGEGEPPVLQRMFYRAAGGVVGDLQSTPAAEIPATLGGNAATAPVTSAAPSAAAASTAASSGTAAPGTTISITNNPAPAAAAAPAAPAPGAAPTGTLGQGMTAVDDTVVFTDTSSPPAVWKRTQLLTMLDLPRPEVLMNMWSLQASSPNGKEIATGLQRVRDLVSANNDALQHAIDYGWAYLSRQIATPGFFDKDFHDYLTKRFVADTARCSSADAKPGDCAISDAQRKSWNLCGTGKYCLGYSDAFHPLRPTLTNIILTMMASKDISRTVLTTIGCMEGKFEVYGETCFPDRPELWPRLPHRVGETAASEGPNTVACLTAEREKFLRAKGGGAIEEWQERDRESARNATSAISCELLDRAAVAAQRACGLPATLPLSCFTLQAAASFLPESSFSTFSLVQLNELAEKDMASFVPPVIPYSASNVGLLRSAVADFLFNYKMSQQFPGEFGTYALPHSAQELNARFNPLVVAFNQDVGALSRALMDEIQDDLPNQNHIWQLWRHNKSYIANGLVTVRGISGVESLVDTDTQNAFDSTQAQTLNAVLGSITGSGSSSTAAAPSSGVQNTITINPDGSSAPAPSSGSSGPSPLAAVAGLFRGATSATAIATALAAITPTETHSIIGRQLTLDVIPHTLPGASSAELDVRLWAQEDSAPTIYSSSGSESDFQSRVARHNVATRVRVESLKLFDVSSFSAMVQRPRAKLPIVPPLIEIPLIGSLLSVPLPAAKVYHASSAIVSAIIVPTAADLAYGLVFRSDRAVFPEEKRFTGLNYSLRRLTSRRQFPPTAPIFAFHDAMVQCLASGSKCGEVSFDGLPPER